MFTTIVQLFCMAIYTSNSVYNDAVYDVHVYHNCPVIGMAICTLLIVIHEYYTPSSSHSTNRVVITLLSRIFSTQKGCWRKVEFGNYSTSEFGQIRQHFFAKMRKLTLLSQLYSITVMELKRAS